MNVYTHAELEGMVENIGLDVATYRRLALKSHLAGETEEEAKWLKKAADGSEHLAMLHMMIADRSRNGTAKVTA